jgi:hypothetical protein
LAAPLKLEPVYSNFMTAKPYGLLPWIEQCIATGIKALGHRFSSHSASITPELYFIPPSYSTMGVSLAITREEIQRKVRERLVLGKPGLVSPFPKTVTVMSAFLVPCLSVWFASQLLYAEPSSGVPIAGDLHLAYSV